jgi:hypothetical protein
LFRQNSEKLLFTIVRVVRVVVAEKVERKNPSVEVVNLVKGTPHATLVEEATKANHSIKEIRNE